MASLLNDILGNKETKFWTKFHEISDKKGISVMQKLNTNKKAAAKAEELLCDNEKTYGGGRRKGERCLQKKFLKNSGLI